MSFETSTFEHPQNSAIVWEKLGAWALGIYREMGIVYGATVGIALMSRLSRGTRSPGVVVATTLAGSCLFFIVTNFAVWAGGSFYPPTAEGLASCYAAAIPFFRNALFGDLFTRRFSLVHGHSPSRVPALRPAPVGA
jgi:hypothetical protein